MIRDITNSSLLFRGKPAVRCYPPASVPRVAARCIPTPDCTPLRSVCQGLLRLRFSETRDKCGAESANRRLANGGVKKSGGASVKNGELSEDERNEMKLIKFFAV